MSRLDRPGRIRILQDACSNARNGRRPRIRRVIRQLIDQADYTRSLGGRSGGPGQ
jgi:hypothetical protein